MPGAVDQQGQRSAFVTGPEGDQFEPVKPGVTEVVLVERSTRSQREQMFQGTILLRPVGGFFTITPGKPLLDFREFAVNEP